MAVAVSRGDVIAFRLHAQHLTERSDEVGLLAATGACGVQNSPPGSALLALHARVRDLTPERLDQAVAENKSLLQSWCMRGAPFYFPTADAGVFTAGALPPTEEARQQLIIGVRPAVDELGLSLTQAVDLTGAEISDVLAGRRLAIDELGAELCDRIAGRLTKQQRDIWQQEGPYAAGQPLGVAVVHFCIRILTLQGLVCLTPREANKTQFALVEEWLGAPIQDSDPQAARAELLRRYLHCYGPARPAEFAAWLGVRAGDAAAWWSLVEDEMTRVDFGGKTWVLREDLAALRSPPTPRGVRLLPPRDPYTQLRDRETILDEKYRREVWKPIGSPGTVLVDGDIAGIWRARKQSRRLTINIKTFDGLAPRNRESLQAEAEQIAALRGASSVQIRFEAD